MTTFKMLFVAGSLTLGWLGVAGVCFSSIATVPANLAKLSQPRLAPAAPAMSVASARGPSSTTATP
jgi:hypothetical protein